MGAATANRVKLGVIGGSGLYDMPGVEIVTDHELHTPFGQTSDRLIETVIGGRTVMFLPRHGRGHRLLPQEIPYRANVYAMKQLGVTHLLAISAVGIMREDIKPGDMVIPDQLFDRTKGIRESTFFGEGLVGHVMFADPFCEELRGIVGESAREQGATVHSEGTYVCMEGPVFSTRAESHFYRETVRPAVIGMTAVPEAKLAREAEMCYALLATGTDYDCWHASEDDVSVEAIVKVLHENAELANRIVRDVAGRLPETSDCRCLSAAQYAFITDRACITDDVKDRVRVLYGKYLD